MEYFLILFLLSVALSNAQENGIFITPNSPKISRKLGENFYAICTGNGTPKPYNIKWFTPSGEEMTDENRKNYAEHTEEKARVYVYNISREDVGVYTCVAEISGSKLMKTIELTTYQPIEFIHAPEEQELVVNTTSKVYCSVIGEQPLEVTWPLVAGSTTPNDRVLFQEDGLLIKSVQPSDGGQYICLATSTELGTMMEKHIRVNVTSPPLWVNPPSDVTAHIGTNIKVLCQADGKPQPEITFYKNSVKIFNDSNFRINPSEGYMLINDIKKNDEGFYKCEAVNRPGTIMSDFKINLLEPPIIKRFDNHTVKQNENLTVECMAEGDPSPTIHIVKESNDQKSQILDENNSRVSFESFLLSSQIVNAILIIKNVSRSDAGTYSCVAENNAGNSRQNNLVTVQYAPIIDKLISRSVYFLWAGHSINLTCKADSNPMSIFRWYFRDRDLTTYSSKIYYDPIDGISNFLVEHNPRIYGDGWRCEASNIYGTDRHEFIIKEAVPPSPPSTVRFTHVTPTTVNFQVSENELFHDDLNPILNVTDIYVKFKTFNQAPNDITKNDQIKKFMIGGPYIIDNLRADTDYIFTLYFGNEVGNGKESKDFHVKTSKERVPFSPTIVSPPKTSKEELGYDLIWKEPLDGGKPVLDYEIKWIQGTSSKNSTKFKPHKSKVYQIEWIKAPINHFRIKYLLPDSIYKIEIRARNLIGLSLPDSIVIRIMSDQISAPLGPGDYNPSHRGLTKIAWMALIILICLLALLLVDLYCYCNNKCGLIMFLSIKFRGKNYVRENGGIDLKSPKDIDKNDSSTISSTNRHALNNHGNNHLQPLNEEKPFENYMPALSEFSENAPMISTPLSQNEA
ncbi:unnamed protein product [Gordionus sp. m RMFG-2023]|uniref:fasciclin-2-like n=1 Tax=Gordionus sp. m RMFG-2023 TaxID=3053472 RepID=UPI0030E5723F